MRQADHGTSSAMPLDLSDSMFLSTGPIAYPFAPASMHEDISMSTYHDTMQLVVPELFGDFVADDPPSLDTMQGTESAQARGQGSSFLFNDLDMTSSVADMMKDVRGPGPF
jgi:hypothetical protein